jgi:hypothetical protein
VQAQALVQALVPTSAPPKPWLFCPCWQRSCCSEGTRLFPPFQGSALQAEEEAFATQVARDVRAAIVRGGNDQSATAEFLGALLPCMDQWAAAARAAQLTRSQVGRVLSMGFRIGVPMENEELYSTHRVTVVGLLNSGWVDTWMHVSGGEGDVLAFGRSDPMFLTCLRLIVDFGACPHGSFTAGPSSMEESTIPMPWLFYTVSTWSAHLSRPGQVLFCTKVQAVLGAWRLCPKHAMAILAPPGPWGCHVYSPVFMDAVGKGFAQDGDKDFDFCRTQQEFGKAHKQWTSWCGSSGRGSGRRAWVAMIATAGQQEGRLRRQQQSTWSPTKNFLVTDWTTNLDSLSPDGFSPFKSPTRVVHMTITLRNRTV